MPGWLDPSFAARTDAPERWRAYARPASGEDQRRGMAVSPLWETIFIGSDPAFTFAPVKARWPFFDLRLLEFMAAVPQEPWCRSKYLLRTALEGSLPESVRLRPKTPLRAPPLHAALREKGVPAWMPALASGPELEPYADRAHLARLLGTPASLTPGVLTQVNLALSLAWWLRHRRRPEAGRSEEGTGGGVSVLSGDGTRA